MSASPATVVPADRRGSIATARVAYDRFATVVESLHSDDWDLPTDCEAWSVRDLVGHVVGAMRSAASIRELLSQQREIKRRLETDGGTETDVMTQVQVDRTAELSTTELTRQCRALVERATDGRRRIPAPIRRFVTFPVDMEPVQESWALGYLVDVILTRDAWLHRIDLCRAINHDPVLTSDHDRPIIADVVAEWARRHGHPFRLTLNGPAGGTYCSDATTDDPTIELDAVEFCRIVSGREPGNGLLTTPVPF